MNKKDIIEKVAEQQGLSKAESGRLVDAVIDTIKGGVAAEGKVSIAGFGNFEVRTRSARKGRNPKTGEEIDIAESKNVGFKAGTVFKQAL